MHKFVRRHALIAGLILVLAQLSLLAHAFEHELEQDQPHAPCLLCHAADHLGDAVQAAVPTVSAIPKGAHERSSNYSAARGETTPAFQARAPPTTLLT